MKGIKRVINSMPCYWLILIVIMISLNVQAQSPYAWHWGTEDGLPSIETYDIFEDSKGYIWIGTDKGVCKYNGQHFSYYHNKIEKGEAISHFKEDSKGRVWMRNFRNQVFYVENDSLHYFKALDQIPPFEFTKFMIDSKDRVWLLDKFKNVIYRYQPEVQKWKKWRISKNIMSGGYSIIEKDNHNTYIATSDGIYNINKDDKLSLVTDSINYSSPNIEKFYPCYLYKDKVGNILIYQHGRRSVEKVMQLVDNKTQLIPNYSNREETYKYGDFSLSIDKYNTIWELTIRGVSVIVNPDSSKGLKRGQVFYPDEAIGCLITDREGNYWVSSLSNGVRMIPNMQVQLYNESDSIFKNTLIEVIEKIDTARLAIGMNNGELWVYNIYSKQIELVENLPNKVNYLKKIRGKLLVGGEHFQKVYQLKKGLYELENLNKLSVYCKNSVLYKGTNLIVSAAEGFDIYNMNNERYSYDNSLNILPVKGVKLVREEDVLKGMFRGSRCHWVSENSENGYFLAALADGLMCYSESAKPYAILDRKEQPIQANRIKKGTDGITWVCSNNKGIYGLDKNLKVKYHFMTQDGLIHNTIGRIEISQGNLWLISSKGVQSFNPKTKESHIYTIQDGLPTHDIKDIAILGGRVWLATVKGLVTFDKNMPSKNQSPPLIYIKEVAIHDKPITLKERYELDYTQDNLVIYVEGIAHRSQGSFKYKYRMLGIDSTWRYQTSQNDFMRFPQLQPGNYQFEVVTVNEDGVESEEPVVIHFYIAAPYWQRWWFILLVSIIVIAIITTIVWGQLQQLKLKNQNSNLRMEALQSQMNPHFIFNVLTAVQNLWLQHKNELAMDLQSNFAKLLRRIFQYSSKKAISIEQVEEFLNNYLRLEQIRFEHQVAITFEIEEELLEDDYSIPPLLIQPIIENSFKHGLFHKDADRQLTILFKKEVPYLYVCVEDNGVGRKPKPKDAPQRSSGLSTTKERLAILQNSIIEKPHLHNNIKITDLTTKEGKAKGTKVELWIPFVEM